MSRICQVPYIVRIWANLYNFNMYNCTTLYLYNNCTSCICWLVSMNIHCSNLVICRPFIVLHLMACLWGFWQHHASVGPQGRLCGKQAQPAIRVRQFKEVIDWSSLYIATCFLSKHEPIGIEAIRVFWHQCRYLMSRVLVRPGWPERLVCARPGSQAPKKNRLSWVTFYITEWSLIKFMVW